MKHTPNYWSPLCLTAATPSCWTILVKLSTPAIRQSQHNFHLLSHFTSTTTGPMFTKFYSVRAISAAILMQRVKAAPYIQLSYVLNRTPASLIWILQNFYAMYRNDCRLMCWNRNCDMSSLFRNAMSLLNKRWSSNFCWFAAQCSLSTQLWLKNYWIYVHQVFLYDVEALAPLLMCALICKAIFRFGTP